MIPTEPVNGTATCCIPRESGDDPVAIVVSGFLGRYSPRERG